MTVSPDRFVGALLGQCLGDALGLPVEGQAPEPCELYVETTVRPGRVPPGPAGTLWRQYSDDSQLAREMVQSYVARRGYYSADYARRIAALFREGRVVGHGLSTWSAAQRLISGIHWDEAGAPAPAAGNGSAMRAGPIGLFHYDDPAALRNAAVQQSIITHRDPRCCAGSVAVASAVAQALEAQTIAPAPFLSAIVKQVEGVDGDMATCISLLRDEWLALPPEEAVGPISRAGKTDVADEAPPGISPFVVPSVLWSLYAFLRSPHAYTDTVSTAIAAGGDADTTAAMAGAISGAFLGREGLPGALARRLHDSNTWGYDALVCLAMECYAIKHGGRGRAR